MGELACIAIVFAITSVALTCVTLANNRRIARNMDERERIMDEIERQIDELRDET